MVKQWITRKSKRWCTRQGKAVRATWQTCKHCLLRKIIGMVEKGRRGMHKNYVPSERYKSFPINKSLKFISKRVLMERYNIEFEYNRRIREGA